MSDLHIDDFHKDVAKSLILLYQHFPRPIVLYVEDIIGPDQADEFGLHSDRHMSCFSAIQWLASAGYLSYIDNIRQEALDQAVLTHKGFMRLCTPCEWVQKSPSTDPLPSSVSAEQSTIIYQLREAVKSRSSIETGKMVHYFLNQAG